MNIYLEMLRLTVGLGIVLFHRQVADWALAQDQMLLELLHSRGVRVPRPLGEETMRTVYCSLGLLVIAVQAGRLYPLL